MGNYTSYSNFYKGTEDELMSNPDPVLDNNWDKMIDIPSPPMVATGKPPVNTYNLYDRVYVQDTKSILILISKDTVWGEYWRPVHAGLGPWTNVPNTALALAGWSTTVDSTAPWQIALDNRGRCHWRGAVGISSGMDNTSTYDFIKDMPTNLRPARNNWIPVGVNTVNVGATGLSMWQGAALFLDALGRSTDVTIRLRGGNGSITPGIVYFDGLAYDLGTSSYLNP